MLNKNCIAKLEVGDDVSISYHNQIYVVRVIGFIRAGMEHQHKLPILAANEKLGVVIYNTPNNFIESVRAMMNKSGYKYFGILDGLGPWVTFSIVKILKCQTKAV